MFSYRHAFHAGNHADVLKHSILIYTLEYFKQKETAFWLIDTHAGTGLYDLSGLWASQSQEQGTGLSRLTSMQTRPKLIDSYLNTIKNFNQDGSYKIYPGSPSIAFKALRKQDKLFLFELLEAEYLSLINLMQSQYQAKPKQVHIELANGFIKLPKLLPPTPRRAIILIDPSYEDKADYKNTCNAIKLALKKFPQATILLWHPLVQRVQLQEMLRVLKQLPVKWLHTELYVKTPSANGLGMHGSGMFVINPPWTLKQELQLTLPWLSKTLGQDNFAKYLLDDYEPKP